MQRRHLFIVLAFALFAGPLAAQETTGKIQGRVVDAQSLAVPGATVIATGVQGSKNTVTDGDGRYTIPFLTPGVYSVRAELQGFKAIEQKDVSVRVGQTADVPLKLEVGGVAEVVQVTGAARVVDTTSTTIGAVINTDDLKSIPIGRTFSATMYLSPGVSSSGTAGVANPSMSGASGLENQYVVDGTNVTNTGYGGLGSYSITFGSLGNATPYDFIKEVQVKTGGYEAEFGQATGGVVNVITKSGANELRGSAFAYSQPSGLEAGWRQYQAINGSVNTSSTSRSDAGIEAGGRVIKDRLFFFGAIDPGWQTSKFTAPAGFPLQTLGEVARDRQTTSYAAKGTLQLTTSNRIDASFFGDPSHGDVGPQRTTALTRTNTAGFSTLDYGGHQQSVKYDGILSSTFLVEASFARSHNRIGEVPSVDQWDVTDTTIVPNVRTGGIGSYEQGNVSNSKQWAVKATNIFKGHQVKYGVQFDDVDYQQLNQRTGPTFTAPDGRQTATGAQISIIPDVTYGKIYRVTRANFNVSRDIPQTYTNFFAQDTWRVGDRLTINPGIRYEQEKMSGTIIKDWQLKNNWAPRIGAAYDLAGDGRTKLFGNYGIFYARIPLDLAARALSADDSFTRGDYFDANLTRVVPQGVVTQTPDGSIVTNHFILAGVGADTIDPSAKLSYTTELVLGIEREIMPRTTFGARYVHRNMPRVLEDVANCPMVAYEQAATSGVCSNVEYILTNPSSATPINPAAIALNPALAAVKFDDPVHNYDALELTMTRRGSNWNAMTSYRYSRLRGNFEGFYRDDNGQSDPGISSLYDFPTNDPTYTAIGGTLLGYPGDIRFLGDPHGILPLDRPHQFKLNGNYVFLKNLNVGANLNLVSGKPLTPMAANPNYTSRGEIPEAARGTGIQTIDGFKTRTPFETQLDLQTSYIIPMGTNRRLTVIGEFFNLFNSTRVTSYDQNTQLTYPAANPDFGAPVDTNFGGTPPQFQAPFNMRVGVRFEF